MKRSTNHRTTGQFLNLHGIQPIARAIMVVSAIAVLATGVTYAALQSPQVALTGNTISTATVGLQIGTSDSSFASSRVGFKFANVIPGAAATPADGNAFYLKNTGSVAMTLKAAINSVPTNISSVDLSKVFLIFSRVDTNATQSISVASLVDANATGGVALTDNLDASSVAQYKVQVTMDDDAFTGTSATVGNIDLVFTGVLVSQ